MAPLRTWALPAGALLLFCWAALAPLPSANRDLLFDIPLHTLSRPTGTALRASASPNVSSTVYLTLGVKDVLLLRNSDRLPLVFGPVLVLPGREFRLPFEQVAEHEFACNAHLSGQVKVVVGPTPNPGLERVSWRLGALAHALRTYKKV